MSKGTPGQSEADLNLEDKERRKLDLDISQKQGILDKFGGTDTPRHENCFCCIVVPFGAFLYKIRQ